MPVRRDRFERFAWYPRRYDQRIQRRTGLRHPGRFRRSALFGVLRASGWPLCKQHPDRFAPRKSASLRSAPVRSAPCKFVGHWRSAPKPWRSAIGSSERLASRRLVDCIVASLKLAPRTSDSLKSARVRIEPVRSVSSSSQSFKGSADQNCSAQVGTAQDQTREIYIGEVLVG